MVQMNTAIQIIAQISTKCMKKRRVQSETIMFAVLAKKTDFPSCSRFYCLNRQNIFSNNTSLTFFLIRL